MANNEQIFRNAVNAFGESAILEKCIATAAELIVTLQHFKGGYQDATTVQGDLARVLVACGLAANLYGIDGVTRFCDKEIERIAVILNKVKESAHV